MPGAEERQRDLERHRVHEQERREHEQRRSRGAAGAPRPSPPPSRIPDARAASTNGCSRSAEHLAAQRACHVGHVHEPDHERSGSASSRTPIVTGPMSHPLRLSAVLSRAPRSSAGNDQSRSSSAADDRVGAPAPVAGREAERDAQAAASRSTAPTADHERGARAVQQADHHVAAVLVRPEEVVAPARSGRSGSRRARRRSIGLPSIDRRVREVVLRRRRVRDLARVQRRREQRERRSARTARRTRARRGRGGAAAARASRDPPDLACCRRRYPASAAGIASS